MTANVSHEVNTPLSCIISFADRIIEEGIDESLLYKAKMIKHGAN